MSNNEQQKSTEETLSEFNTDVNNFLNENKERILCMMAYSVSYDMQPYVASYQKNFNHNVISKYDAKTIYAYNLGLPNFLNVYFIMKKLTDNTTGEHTKQECQDLISKFNRENEHVLAGLSAFFYDVNKLKKIDEQHFGDKESLSEIQSLKIKKA